MVGAQPGGFLRDSVYAIFWGQCQVWYKGKFYDFWSATFYISLDGPTVCDKFPLTSPDHHHYAHTHTHTHKSNWDRSMFFADIGPDWLLITYT